MPQRLCRADGAQELGADVSERASSDGGFNPRRVAGVVEIGMVAFFALCTLMALGPQLLGHTAYNWSLRYVSATFVAVVTLGEPVGSALLAFLIFGEGFAPLQFVGFSLLLVGIYLAAKGERS